MFSLEKFYDVIDENLLTPLKIDHFHFANNHGTLPHDLAYAWTKSPSMPWHRIVLSYDQEPLYLNNLAQFWDPVNFNCQDFISDPGSSLMFYTLTGRYCHGHKHFIPDFFLLANSEHSQEKTEILRYLDNTYDWYYFFHGFAALDWFGNIPYRKPIFNYSKVFISFNHLFTTCDSNSRIMA